MVSSFGVERDMHSGQYKWATFRSLAKLDKKFDETLTEYFLAFYHMCMTVCKRYKTPEEGKKIILQICITSMFNRVSRTGWRKTQ